MNLFLAICEDPHGATHVKVFSTPEGAILRCEEFAAECSYDGDELEEQELSDAAIESGWLYHATYNEEGGDVRVERTTLDNLP